MFVHTLCAAVVLAGAADADAEGDVEALTGTVVPTAGNIAEHANDHDLDGNWHDPAA